MVGKSSCLRSASVAALATVPVIFGCALASAAPLTFDFSWVGGHGGATGEIDGLSDNSTGPASAVIVDSVTSNNPGQPVNFVTPPQTVTASPPWNVSANDFTVSNGQITATDFSSIMGGNRLCFNSSNNCPFANPGSLASMAFLSGPNGVFTSGTPTFTLTSAPPTPEIPLPATLPLFASGLGAMGLLGWRRKRRAQAVA